MAREACHPQEACYPQQVPFIPRPENKQKSLAGTVPDHSYTSLLSRLGSLTSSQALCSLDELSSSTSQPALHTRFADKVPNLSTPTASRLLACALERTSAPSNSHSFFLVGAGRRGCWESNPGPWPCLASTFPLNTQNHSTCVHISESALHPSAPGPYQVCSCGFRLAWLAATET